MKIVRPYAKLLNVPDQATGISLLRVIEAAARVSHRSEDAQVEASWDRFIRTVVLQHGDWSVVEHVSASVEFLVDRGITHEIVRHRLFSYTQESTRFVNYEKKMPPSFIYPKEGEIDQDWREAIESCELKYRALLEKGWRPQEARSVFPNALASKIIMTGNVRNWRHFFLMRTSREAHPQMRQVTIPLLATFKERIPILFEDIEPEQRQVENIARGR